MTSINRVSPSPPSPLILPVISWRFGMLSHTWRRDWAWRTCSSTAHPRLAKKTILSHQIPPWISRKYYQPKTPCECTLYQSARWSTPYLSYVSSSYFLTRQSVSIPSYIFPIIRQEKADICFRSWKIGVGLGAGSKLLCSPPGVLGRWARNS